MAKYKDFKEVVERLGVALYGLPTDEVRLGADMYLCGSCILVDLESGVRLRAESLPVEIFGRVTEHWGVRNEDGSIEIFVVKMKEMSLVDEKVTPHKHSASLLSLLVKKGANLIVLHDKIFGTGCVCGAFVGSRIAGERTDFVRPKPFADYDPYGESEAEICMVGTEFGDMLEAMRKLAAGKPEPESAEPMEADQEDSAYDEPEPESDEQPQVVEAESAEPGDAAGQASEADESEEDYSVRLSSDEIDRLLKGLDPEPEDTEVDDGKTGSEARDEVDRGTRSEAAPKKGRPWERKNNPS